MQTTKMYPVNPNTPPFVGRGKTDGPTNLQDQLKAIRLTIINNAADTCNTCNLTYIPFYKLGGVALCPTCEVTTIEAFKASQMLLTPTRCVKAKLRGE